MRFISKFNHDFTYGGCLHCAILKAWHGFKKKRAHKVREMSFFLQNVQNVIFKVLKMFKNNKKFTRPACWINSKIGNRDKNTTFMILLFRHYCWSVLWRNYWRNLMLWNCTYWSPLKLTVQIQFVLHPCDPFLINNRIIAVLEITSKC